MLFYKNIKGATKDFLLFGSWFVSKRLNEDVMDFYSDMIVMVKTNAELFFNNTIDNLTND